MRYVSTRGEGGYKTFEEAIFSGYADDGGLFVPEYIPKIDADTLAKWRHLSYPELVEEILTRFVSEEDIPRKVLQQLLSNAFSRFDVEEVIKISSFGDLNIGELWHGPTLAFKDLAMTCVGEFYNYFLSKRKKHVTILVGTTGDTGSSAIEAVRGKECIDIIVIYPHERITKIQELMTTTILEDNVHVYATTGGLDDAENVFKDMFSNEEYVQRHNLCSINSINWGRIMVQIAHHVYMYLRMAEPFGKPVDIVIPTGACGNIAAGAYAVEMGVPINFICVVNENDIIHRAIQFNDFKVVSETKATLSSAMDIQNPYNMERLIWIFSGMNAEVCKSVMGRFDKSAEASIPKDVLDKLSKLRTAVATDDTVLAAMKKCYDLTGYIACPHTATALAYYYGMSQHGTRQSSGTRRKDGELAPVVIVATAAIHKFPECLAKAGIDQYEAPPEITELFLKKTRLCIVQNDEWEKILRAKIEELTKKSQS